MSDETDHTSHWNLYNEMLEDTNQSGPLSVNAIWSDASSNEAVQGSVRDDSLVSIPSTSSSRRNIMLEIFSELKGMNDNMKQLNYNIDKLNITMEKLNDSLHKLNSGMEKLNCCIDKFNYEMGQLNQGIIHLGTRAIEHTEYIFSLKNMLLCASVSQCVICKKRNSC